MTYTDSAVRRSNLVAHEIGHTVGASHDTGSTDFIMYPSNGGNDRYFSQTSINSFLAARNDACITPYVPPDTPTATPTKAPTTSPTMSPTALTCGQGESLISLDLLTDNYGSETSWQILAADGVTEVASGGGYNSQTTYNERMCVPSDACTFIMYDSFGDGICCGYGLGSYTLKRNGVTIVTNAGEFAREESQVMCSGPPPPPLDPTASPTVAPTKTPTKSPTKVPTSRPTVRPTTSPTTSPTPPITAAPTPFTCGAGESLVVLDLLTDNYGEESSWKIFAADGVTEVAAGGNYQDATTYQEKVCIPSDACTFTMYDSYGDGICCGYGLGSYTLTRDGVVIVTNAGEFTNEDTLTMCTGTASPTSTPTTPPTRMPIPPVPTMNPTKSPTTTPTRSPTNAPTGRPTTSEPTINPTSNPTNTPTASPTIAPTERPTTSPPTTTPTIAPTASPTLDPTGAPSLSAGDFCQGLANDPDNHCGYEKNGDPKVMMCYYDGKKNTNRSKCESPGDIEEKYQEPNKLLLHCGCCSVPDEISASDQDASCPAPTRKTRKLKGSTPRGV